MERELVIRHGDHELEIVEKFTRILAEFGIEVEDVTDVETTDLTYILRQSES